MSVISDNNILLILKSNSDKLLSVVLKVMIVSEAIIRLVILVKGKIIENSVCHVFVQLTYSSFSVRAFTLIKGVSICGTDPNPDQAYKLAGIDW